MLQDVSLPDGVARVRTTPTFTAGTIPPGLRHEHRLAADVWGRLRVRAGTVTFVLEGTGEARTLHAGETQVIEPDVAHHVEPSEDAELDIAFYR